MGITRTCDHCSKTIDATTGVRVIVRDLESGANLVETDRCLDDLGTLEVPEQLQAKPAPAAGGTDQGGA